MSRKDIISLCIVVAAIAIAVMVPMLADDPAAPVPSQVGSAPAEKTFTTSGDATPVPTVTEPVPPPPPPSRPFDDSG
jgi:hypothetical protein